MIDDFLFMSVININSIMLIYSSRKNIFYLVIIIFRTNADASYLCKQFDTGPVIAQCKTTNKHEVKIPGRGGRAV